tara:strand:+ start:797 stop:1126 length:330 start_codon:yes stop_codon:yes gene_type:complete
MNLNHYQHKSRETAKYPNVGNNPIYPTLGLAGEAGEVADKVKKILRDNDGNFDELSKKSLKLELGDVLWYVAQLATELEIELEDIARANLEKLADRSSRGKIKGNGDYR